MITAAPGGLAIGAFLSVGAIGLFAALMAAASGHIHFATDDGLNVALARFIEEIRSGKKIAMIGDGQRRHFLGRSFVKQFASFASSIQQAEISVNVKMNKLRLTHGPRF